jgi:ADP-L-glycero-D-manno-heptose 6-epimerase
MSRKIIVTGGAGFIGRNLVAGLNEQGLDEIMIVDELGSTEKWRNLIGLRYEDYVDKDAFRAMIRDDKLDNVRAILHMGACSATTEQNATYLADNNYQVTRELCEWCLTHGARLVYASSAATYGDGSLGYSDRDETTPTLKPLNMYGYSKHMFDLWALKKGLFSLIAGLKYFNVYGPYEDHKGDMRSVVHKAYGQIREMGKVKLFKSYRPDYADGEQLRDFVYVRDAVAVTLYLMDHPEVSGLFNCGTGQARSWNALARAVFAAMNREPSIEYVEMPENLRGKYQYHTEADMTKLRESGYAAPFTSLEDGIRDYVTEYLTKQQTDC